MLLSFNNELLANVLPKLLTVDLLFGGKGGTVNVCSQCLTWRMIPSRFR